jgi:hypothetical protein
MELVSWAGAKGSHDVGSSGITNIHRKTKTFISNDMSRCVRECEEIELLNPVIAIINSSSFYSDMPTRTTKRIKRGRGNHQERLLESPLKWDPWRKNSGLQIWQECNAYNSRGFNGVQKPVSSAKKVLTATTQKVASSVAKRRPCSGFTWHEFHLGTYEQEECACWKCSFRLTCRCARVRDNLIKYYHWWNSCGRRFDCTEMLTKPWNSAAIGPLWLRMGQTLCYASSSDGVQGKQLE